MCGRFTLTIHHFGELIDTVGAELATELLDFRPRYNIAPGNRHWILRCEAGRREVLPADWGLINHWSTDPAVGFKQINARAETLAERPAFREAFRRRRCLIPADGFYEWRGPRGSREPIWFHAEDRSVFWMAGLYEGWRDPQRGLVRTTFTIITTAANTAVAEVHDRMPAILSREQIEPWLTGDSPANELGPAPVNSLVGSPASPRLNSAAHDDPDLLDPDDPQFPKQLALF